MNQVDILVEEPSAEEALRYLLPKIMPPGVRPKIINMRNKSNLLKNLPARLHAYKKRLNKGENLRLVVLVDKDNDDCVQLKATLEKMAREAQLPTKSSPDATGHFIVLNRIVVEELESWFLGDSVALRKAFPSLPIIHPRTKPFANPDNGGSWEALHRFLKKHGIYKNSYPKIDAARKIAQHMNISENRCKSFQKFVSGIQTLFS